jgi:hypothetical protein
MKCSQAAPLFSPYLDGAVSGKQMRAIQQHLDDCATCNREYVDLSRTQQLLSKVGRRKAPPEMSLKLRLAISREAARTPRNYFDVLCLRLQHTLQAFMVPAAVGLVTAVLLFGLFMGFSALPLQGDNHDVPLMLYTAPQLQQSPFGILDSIKQDSLVIEADVDSRGRVQDYRVLSNPGDSEDIPSAVKNMLIFSTFRPATSMGVPTSGKAVLSFSKICVRG